jgi:alanyl-tRNA synthetase
MFYDMNGEFIGQEMSQEFFIEQVKKESFIEIWNDVFMEYEKKDGAVIGKLSQKNVDTGAGLERLTAVMQGKNTAYDTDIFEDIMDYIVTNSRKESSIKSSRIIADHVRTVTLMIADGVYPGNKDSGYVLRRLIRRAIVQADKVGLGHGILVGLRSSFASKYEDIYENLKNDSEKQHEIFTGEIEKFIKTLHNGLKEFEKAEPLLYGSNVSLDTIPMDWNPEKYISGETAFNLFQTFGFPLELTIELAQERGWVVDVITFKKLLGEHQAKSSAGSEQKFKGGLANTNETTVKLHTAHHLLLAALQEVVDKNIHQRGSNITEERLRMDFSFDRKVTPEELQQVEQLVNSWIEAQLPVVRREMPLAEAEKLGAEMEFGAKYPDVVSVYTIQNTDDVYISKEFCGGPHVTNTSEIGKFKIQKEEASSAGVRRIKAVIE